MKSVIFINVFLMIVTCGCNNMNNQTIEIDLEKEKVNLLNADREFAEYSRKNGAAEAFNKFLLPEALQLPNGQQPRYGRDTIFENMKPDDDYELMWEPQEGEVSTNADMGYTWGIYRYIYFNSKGEKVESLGKYLNVWKKRFRKQLESIG